MGRSTLFVASSSQGVLRTGTGPWDVITGYPFTMSCWVNLQDLPASGTVIAGFTNANATFSTFNIQTVNTGTIRLAANYQGTASTIDATGIVTDQWYWICAVCRSATDRELYINNVSVGTDTTNIAFDNNFANASVGMFVDNTGSNARFCDMYASQVIFHASALDSSQRSAVMMDASTGPVKAWWPPLTNSADIGHDNSGYNYNGIPINVPTVSANGPPQVAFSGTYFNGVEQRVDFGNLTVFDGASGVTLSAWLRMPDVTATFKGIVADYGTNLYACALFLNSTNKLTVVIGDGDGTGVRNYLTTSNFSTFASNNQWVHVVGVVSTTSQSTDQIYIDGVAVTSSNTTNTITETTIQASASRSVYIGDVNSLSGYEIKSDIARVVCYPFALTAAEVAALYYGSPRPGTALQCDLDEFGATKYDRSANKNNGTAVSGMINSTSGPPVNYRGAPSVCR